MRLHFGPASLPPEWRHFLFTSGITNLSLYKHWPLPLPALLFFSSSGFFCKIIYVYRNFAFLRYLCLNPDPAGFIRIYSDYPVEKSRVWFEVRAKRAVEVWRIWIGVMEKKEFCFSWKSHFNSSNSCLSNSYLSNSYLSNSCLSNSCLSNSYYNTNKI
jgi:hypothetical protein